MTGNISQFPSTSSGSHATHLEASDDEGVSNPKLVQPKITALYHTKAHAKKRNELITTELVNMIAEDMLPISFVENSRFKKFMKLLEADYSIPSRPTITNRLKLEYNALKTKISNYLEEINFVSLTTDMWTSRATKSYITITAHLISKDWQYITLVLTTEEMSERHTSANLRERLLKVITTWQLNNKVVAVVHDNAANICNAVENIPEFGHSVRCFAHSLQLCVNKHLSEERINNLIKKSSNIVSHFHHSTASTTALQNKQEQLGLEQKKLKQYVKTRWNSIYIMFQRLLEQRPAIVGTLSDRSVTSLQVACHLSTGDDDWFLIEEILKVLKPFEVVTTLLSSAKDSTLSMTKPLIKSIGSNFLTEVETDSPVMLRFKLNLKNEIATRWKEDVICNICSFLDPRYRAYLNKSQQDEVRQILSAELSNFQSEEKENVQTSSNTEVFNYLFPDDTLLSGEEISEIDKYMREDTIAKSASPFLWWKENQNKYPMLCQLARKYLTIPATSVPSERIFSSAGDLVRAKRSCLSSKNINMLLFIYNNVKCSI